ncbi:alkaline phosphatase family protein [Candidatus Binatus sp.]|uniref:alkaline phosphatase family protein n=1 Tax=Candidatus Binatus sp. TaxID=2811406 RepID=UPI002F95C2D6
MLRPKPALTLIRCALISTCVALFALTACSSAELLLHGGETQVKREPRPPEPGPYVLIFAFDGAGYDQLMTAIQSGKAPAMAGMLGKPEGGGLYQYAYSVPNAVSILPSTTIAAWSAIFTGAPTAWNGVPGNEWFVREKMKFYAPVPVSVQEMDDNRAMITDGLVGKSLKSPTLFQQAGVKSAVSLNPVYRGADYFTVIDPVSMVSLYTEFLARGGGENSPEKMDIYEQLDKDSVPKLLASMKDHGVPKIQVVYFPGIDLYTHLATDPLPMEVAYLETVTDPLVARILDAYRNYGILDQTYIVVIADHGHTPVLKDARHALGAGSNEGPAAVVKAAGFRPRKFVLNPGNNEQDYQAAFAYQGAIAYVYLADRSTCPNPAMTCDWKRPPRYRQDVLPVARAFYNSNKTGKPVQTMKDTLDLIFARVPTPPGKNTLEYEIFDGHRLVPIWEYLIRHPRPDLLQLDRRMQWLSAGPYGNRSGDILLLSRSGLNQPIQDRYYFSAPYHSWHGSASMQDSHIPLIVARKDYPGAKLKQLVDKVAGSQPSQLALVPIVRALLTSQPPAAPAVPPAKPGPDQSATPAAKSR